MISPEKSKIVLQEEDRVTYVPLHARTDSKDPYTGLGHKDCEHGRIKRFNKDRTTAYVKFDRDAGDTCPGCDVEDLVKG